MKIGPLDTAARTIVVAEIGNNHEGDCDLAEEMIHLAAEAGADAVKFQTIRAEHLVRPQDRARFEQLKKFELGDQEFGMLAEVAASCGVIFLSTPFCIGSAEFLNNLVPAFKIASGDNTFWPLIKAVAGFGKPIILSGGLASLEDLKRTKSFVERAWEEAGVESELAVLHCVSSYPTARGEANLGAIGTLRGELKCEVGYSDHTLGIDAASLSVALGATIVEKHFTVDKHHSDFRDHRLAADPGEMKALVERIRETEELLGTGEKVPQESEKNVVDQIRRSIVAVSDLKAGHRLTIDDITWVRPAHGLPPGQENDILDRVLASDVAAGEFIKPEMLH